jgi:hypothetical protein
MEFYFFRLRDLLDFQAFCGQKCFFLLLKAKEAKKLFDYYAQKESKCFHNTK